MITKRIKSDTVSLKSIIFIQKLLVRHILQISAGRWSLSSNALELEPMLQRALRCESRKTVGKTNTMKTLQLVYKTTGNNTSLLVTPTLDSTL